MPNPEQLAREKIDLLLAKAGWVVQDYKHLNLGAGLGVAVREFQTVSRLRNAAPSKTSPTARDGSWMKFIPAMALFTWLITRVSQSGGIDFNDQEIRDLHQKLIANQSQTLPVFSNHLLYVSWQCSQEH